MNEDPTTTTTAAGRRLEVHFLGLNGWAVVDSVTNFVVSPMFRTEAEAAAVLAEKEA